MKANCYKFIQDEFEQILGEIVFIDFPLFVKNFAQNFDGGHGIHDHRSKHYNILSGKTLYIECRSGDKTVASLPLKSLNSPVDVIELFVNAQGLLCIAAGELFLKVKGAKPIRQDVEFRRGDQLEVRSFFYFISKHSGGFDAVVDKQGIAPAAHDF